MLLPTLRQYCLDNYDAVVMDGLEADDVLGILSTEPANDEKVIVSIDKDLYQIPGKISKDGITIDEVSPQEADYWHMMQTLCGDATDGYSGCPKVGVKTAQKILGEHANVPLLDLWKRALDAYKKVGYSIDEALAQARVARILRHNDYDRETGGIKLWRIA